MKIVISDDYQDCVRNLQCFRGLAAHDVTIYNDTISDPDRLIERFADADALILIRERTRIDAALLGRLPRLKFISQTGRAANHVDLPACTSAGLPVAAEGDATNAAAELTWALLLGISRRVVTQANAFSAGRWQTELGMTLHGRTLGIAGYGRIGALVARYASAFGMHVMVWGNRENTAARAAADGHEVVADRHVFFSRCDVLSLHARLTPQSRGMITAADLESMKPTAILLNTSRAELIEPGALVAALKAGHPGFAGIDVHENEPIFDTSYALLQQPNVLTTPHIGYVEQDTYERYFGFAIEQLLAWENGKALNLLNPEVWDRRRV